MLVLLTSVVVSGPAMAGLALAMLATFYLGVLPTRVIEYAVESVKAIV